MTIFRARARAALFAFALPLALAGCLAPDPFPAPVFTGTINPDADPIVINGAPGNTINGSRAQMNAAMGRAFAEGRPLRLEGRFVSAGTVMLYALDNVPGSCIDPAAWLGFHRAVYTSAAILQPFPVARDDAMGRAANAAQAEAFRPALARWFLEGIAAGRITGNFTNLRGADMGQFGYRVCNA